MPTNKLLSLVKKTALLILFVAIAVPVRYGSTDPKHLRFRILHSLFSMKHLLVKDHSRPLLSADYRAFENLLRLKPFAELDRLVDPLELAKQLRSSFPLASIVPRPSKCQVNKQTYEYEGHTVDAYSINHHHKKEEIDSDPIILYFHGGAYLRGDIHGYSGFECHLSSLFNMSLIHLEYRLAPENPMPLPVDDAMTLYRALIRDGISSSRLIIMGDSAGGGLTLLTVQSLVAHKIPLPRAIVTMSPWTDLSMSGESYTRNRLTDIMLRYESAVWIVEQVMGPNHAQLARDSPIHSPLFGSFRSFPPMYVTVGTAELVEDDSSQLVDKARKEGVDVTFEVCDHMMHVHPIFFSYYPEARNTLNNIRQWIETKLKQGHKN